jgi:hypothetical protein
MPASVGSMTPEFLVRDTSTEVSAPPRIRIRSLINERCVICHNGDGDDTARLVPFDTYASIALYLRPEHHGDEGRPWLLATLISLFSLAALGCPLFALTSRPRRPRSAILAATAAALLVVAASWIVGGALAVVMFAAVGFAVGCIMLQILASIAELLGISRAGLAAAASEH